MARKPTFSPSSISAYLTCPVKYRYLYIDRIGQYYLRARPGFSFGTTLHQVLQSYHDGGEAQSPDALAEQVEQRWISSGYASTEQEQEFLAAGREIARAYHAAASERAELSVETVATEKYIRTEMGAFVLVGRVDRIDRHADGALEVVDYKSGRFSVTGEEVAGSLAMSIYQFILKKSHPNERVFATIYCLRTGETASHELSVEDVERLGDYIQGLGEEILCREWEEVVPVRIEACQECDFVRRCETYWRQQERGEQLAN